MKIFTGFALDMASDFSGLTKNEIRWLREMKIVSPKKKAGVYSYDFSDLLMLRLVRLLKLYKIAVKNITKARSFIKRIDTSRELTEMQLYVTKETAEILYLGENPQEDSLVRMDFGQLVNKNLLTILPVGRDLEHMRKEVIDPDDVLAKRINSKNLIPLSEVLKKHAAGQ